MFFKSNFVSVLLVLILRVTQSNCCHSVDDSAHIGDGGEPLSTFTYYGDEDYVNEACGKY